MILQKTNGSTIPISAIKATPDGVYVYSIVDDRWIHVKGMDVVYGNNQ